MKKKLVQHGNSLALIIDKPILKLLGIDKETPIKIEIKNNKIIIGPELRRKVKPKSIDDIAEKIMEKYGDTFKKLAK